MVIGVIAWRNSYLYFASNSSEKLLGMFALWTHRATCGQDVHRNWWKFPVLASVFSLSQRILLCSTVSSVLLVAAGLDRVFDEKPWVGSYVHKKCYMQQFWPLMARQSSILRRCLQDSDMIEFVMTVGMTLERYKEPGPPLFSTLVENKCRK